MKTWILRAVAALIAFVVSLALVGYCCPCSTKPRAEFNQPSEHVSGSAD